MQRWPNKERNTQQQTNTDAFCPPADVGLLIVNQAQKKTKHPAPSRPTAQEYGPRHVEQFLVAGTELRPQVQERALGVEQGSAGTEGPPGVCAGQVGWSGEHVRPDEGRPGLITTVVGSR